MITTADLRWWLELAPTLEWTFAKTMADTPHEYVVLDRTPGLTRADFVRAAKVIHTFGEPGKFHASTNIYLTCDDVKWWTMDWVLDETDLINRAEAARTYGRQDAPHTATTTFTEYDGLAVDYDKTRDASKDKMVRQQILEHFGAYAPKTLDVGCGTGALLDLGVVSASLYTGVDPSQAMLNALVRKHPRVSELYPARIEDVSLKERYELVVAMNVPDIDEDMLRRLTDDLLVVI